MSNILLLRAPSQDLPDKYETTFENRGYHPYSISVLETGAVNVDVLRTTISHGPKNGDFEAVVIQVLGLLRCGRRPLMRWTTEPRIQVPPYSYLYHERWTP